MKEMPPRLSRRQVLQATSIGVSSSLAGCIADLVDVTGPEKPERSENAPPLKWISNVDHVDASWNTPNIHGRIIYSAGDYHVWALDATDGSKRWRYEVDPPSDNICYNGKLGVADGIAYAADCEEVYAINENGESHWVVDNNGQIRTAPAISEDALFFGGTNLVRFDRRSGALDWRRDLDGETRAPPVLGRDHVFVGLSDGTLAAFEQSSGGRRLTLETERRVSSVAFADGVVFVATGGTPRSGEGTGHLYAGDVSAQRWLWQVKTGEIRNNLSPAVHNDTTFVVNNAGILYAIAATDGSVRWTFETKEKYPAVPRLGGDLVYVASGDTVHAVDIETGEQRWHIKWDDLSVAGRDSPPLVTVDTLYVGTNEEMYSFGLSS